MWSGALSAPAGLVYRAMGFLPEFFTVLFTIPRVTGGSSQ